MSTNTVFVYGTLKNNQPNHKLMEKQENGVAKFLGRGRTVNRYPLVIASPYNIPFMLYKGGTGKIIQGEVYEVDDTMLSAMDELEEHPSFYQRELTAIALTENGQGEAKTVEKQCWMYFVKRYKPELLELPYYDDYNSRGEHGLAYIEKSKQEQLGIDVRKAVLL